MFLLDPANPKAPFPEVELAANEPDGLLAIGGDLSSERLMTAYRSGIFPWYSEGQPILWWSPNPRMVLFPEKLKLSRSLRKGVRNRGYLVSIDAAFDRVIEACALPRDHDPGTWITRDMITAYQHLYRQGHAHSVEVWKEGVLIGGLYGVALGSVFFGESMFSHARDSSKMALLLLSQRLKRWGYRLIDCQIRTEHLATLGAEAIPRERFCSLLGRWIKRPPLPTAWVDPNDRTPQSTLTAITH